MSKHDRSKPRYPAQVRHGAQPAPASTLDQPTDVLSFDDHERTELHTNLVHPHLAAAQRARPARTAAPDEVTFDAADERTEIQGNIDVDAARALARARFGQDRTNTFDDDERTEYQANPLHAAPHPRQRSNTSSAQARPRTRFQTQGPRQAINPTESRAPQPTPHPVAQARAPQAQRPPHTSGAHPRVHPQSSIQPSPTTSPNLQHEQPHPHRARPSGPFPAAAPARHATHPTHRPATTPQQVAPHPHHPPLEERTEPAHEVHYRPAAPQRGTSAPAQSVHIPAPSASQQSASSPVAPTLERQPLSQLPMGPVNLESKSSLFNVKSLQKVAFLKEETGVEFDLLSMSSPNLNALVLAMGAQELAPELLDERESEEAITPLARKWGDPQSPPGRAMRLNYALWGGFVGLLAGLGVTVLLGLLTPMTLSSLGPLKYLLWTLAIAAGALPAALKPRQFERALLALKPLPLNLPSSSPTPRQD